ncbi:O-methyltransferase [Anabaena sp. CCY 9402-a]|uniref:O-methyltransferase n=1 Tax=Anabaena sp. CCY 9402-a TaxID=3103867 RepID=UPI0039C66108
MNDQENLKIPSVVQNILSETIKIGFQMTSELSTGSLLRTLAASKPDGNFLDIGTGTGVSTAWLLDGMDRNSKIITVENDNTVVSIAQKYLGDDPRISFDIQNAGAFLEQIEQTGEQFDLIFADTWAGKYTHLEAALHILKPGGLYIIDDMLPQTNWPEGHELKVAALIAQLEQRQDMLLTKLNWSSGIIIATKQAR